VVTYGNANCRRHNAVTALAIDCASHLAVTNDQKLTQLVDETLWRPPPRSTQGASKIEHVEDAVALLVAR